MNALDRDIYSKGRAAAKELKSKSSCPYNNSSDLKYRHWWLAGWHDWHIENQPKVL